MVSHFGHEGFIVRDHIQPIPPGTFGEIVVRIGDCVRTREVFLPKGVPAPGVIVSFF